MTEQCKNTVSDIWDTDDVIERYNDMHQDITDPPLSEEQANAIIDLMRLKLDHNTGINWGFVDNCINEVINNKEQTS